jgi:hypothetical protein
MFINQKGAKPMTTPREDQLINWIGGDNYTREQLLNLILELLDGDYTIEDLRKDIRSYQ